MGRGHLVRGDASGDVGSVPSPVVEKIFSKCRCCSRQITTTPFPQSVSAFVFQKILPFSWFCYKRLNHLESVGVFWCLTLLFHSWCCAPPLPPCCPTLGQTAENRSTHSLEGNLLFKFNRVPVYLWWCLRWGPPLAMQSFNNKRPVDHETFCFVD